MKIIIAKEAAQALRRSNKRKLLTQKILALATNPTGFDANIIRLQGRRDFRLRVQDWRIIFRVNDETLFIDAIEPRGSVYEDRS